jgi:amino acid transporter
MRPLVEILFVVVMNCLWHNYSDCLLKDNMEITIIILIVIVVGIFLFMGYKGTKNSKNKPPQVK